MLIVRSRDRAVMAAHSISEGVQKTGTDSVRDMYLDRAYGSPQMP